MTVIGVSIRRARWANRASAKASANPTATAMTVSSMWSTQRGAQHVGPVVLDPAPAERAVVADALVAAAAEVRDHDLALGEDAHASRLVIDSQASLPTSRSSRVIASSVTTLEVPSTANGAAAVGEDQRQRVARGQCRRDA